MPADVVVSSMSSLTESGNYDVDLGMLGATLEVAPATNDAGVAVVEHTLAPHALAAPLHRHSREDEISYVLEGEMTVLADGDLSTVAAGESVVKGRHVWHTFWNARDEPLRFLEIVAPGEFADFFGEAAEFFPIDPTDEGKLASYQELAARYGLEVDFGSIPALCEEHGLRV
jgi:quercetin dioxygenase-like cupin family protein